jgi:ribosomal protein L7/L12
MNRCPACGHDNPAGIPDCERCATALPTPAWPGGSPDDLARRVRQLLAEGHKIDAIKVYREEMGAGLKEAKDAVEAIERGQPFPPQRGVDPPFERELVALLGEGRKIEAIKRYRERTGAGLKAAKDAVEALAARHGLPTTGRSGCLGAIALFVMAVALAWGLAN